MQPHTVLVTGATGYVGTRLVPRLALDGYRVKALGRSLAVMQQRPWARMAGVELVQGDVLDAASLKAAAGGCRSAFYLVHSMIAHKKHFIDADRMAAKHMVAAAAAAGLDRIIYLGGLGDPAQAELSPHLKSRHEVARILQAGPVPTTHLRAAMIMGSGSASFEILRYLTEHLPLMTTPRWVQTPSQPIAIRNVLGYLEGCLALDAVKGQTFDIGGPEIVNYRQLMDLYCELAGLPRRWVIPLPLLTPHLSALWIHLVTPVPSSIAIPLTGGLNVPVTCRDHRIQALIPQRLLGCREAFRLALDRSTQIKAHDLPTTELAPPEWPHVGDAAYGGGTQIQYEHTLNLTAPPETVWALTAQWASAPNAAFHPGWRTLIKTWARIFRMQTGRQTVPFRSLPYRCLAASPPSRLVLQWPDPLASLTVFEVRLQARGNGRTRMRILSRTWPRGLLGLMTARLMQPLQRYLTQKLAAMIEQALALHQRQTSERGRDDSQRLPSPGQQLLVRPKNSRG